MPDDVVGGSSDSKSDLDILNEDDAPASEETTEEPVATTDEEPGEVTFEDEPVAEDETDKPAAKPSEPEIDDTEVPEGQLRFKDIKSKYPNIFKEIPQLAQAIRNDRAY